MRCLGSFRRTWLRLRLLIALGALAACGTDALAPAEIDGLYTLERMNGSPMPYDHEGLGCCTYLSGKLELERQRYTISLTARNRNTNLVFTAREWGSYERGVSSVTFAPDSFDVTPFLLDVGRVSADSIDVALGGEGPGSPDQFQALFVLVG